MSKFAIIQECAQDVESPLDSLPNRIFKVSEPEKILQPIITFRSKLNWQKIIDYLAIYLLFQATYEQSGNACKPIV